MQIFSTFILSPEMFVNLLSSIFDSFRDISEPSSIDEISSEYWKIKLGNFQHMQSA